MKCGRCSNQELNEFSELLSAGLAKRPHASVAIVVAPWLCSEKVCNGYRGELRPGLQKMVAFNETFKLGHLTFKFPRHFSNVGPTLHMPAQTLGRQI